MEPRVLKMQQKEHITINTRTVSRPVSMHLHSFYELEMVLEGSGEQNLNGTVYPLEEGSIYFLTPIDFHSIAPKTQMRVINLSFDETLLSPQLQLLFMNRRENYSFPPTSGVNNTLQTLFSLLQAENECSDEHTLQCRRDLLELLLYTVARGKSRGTVGSNQLHRSMQYLFRHFREDISLEEVARQSGYTPNYFSALFHESTGEKFVELLGKLRLNYAKMLLQSTELSITEVAERSGFGSASALHRHFHKALGIAPSKYRQTVK